MATPAKLEVTLKLNQLPDAATVKDGWKEIKLDCEGREVTFTVRPKMWNKLAEAQAKWPQWVAAITGLMGPARGTGFVLLEPNIQVFERKAKAPDPGPPAA